MLSGVEKVKLGGAWGSLVCRSGVAILSRMMGQGLTSRGILSRDLKYVREQSTCSAEEGWQGAGTASAKSLSVLSVLDVARSLGWSERSDEGESGGKEACEAVESLTLYGPVRVNIT